MIIEFNRRFLKDLSEFAQRAVNEIYTQITDAAILYDVPNCIKLQGADNLYRVRFGDYRLVLLL